jgi:hypothetical protein
MPLSDDASNSQPCDFATHLSSRLGLATNETLSVLGSWLLAYEPVVRRDIAVLTRAAPVSRRSAA